MGVPVKLAVGGMWDVLRVPSVREAADHLNFPTYALVILGIWKLCAVPVLLSIRCRKMPRSPSRSD